MHSDSFEKAFSDYLETHEYDEAENYLFSMVRLAFIAGWRAAGGEPPRSKNVFALNTPQPDSEKTPGDAP